MIQQFNIQILQSFLLVTAILIPVASNGQARLILFDQIRDAYTGEIPITDYTNIGSFQSSSQSSDNNSTMFAELNSNISFSENVLSISGSGNASMNVIGSHNLNDLADSTIYVDFAVISGCYYSIVAKAQQTDNPSLNVNYGDLSSFVVLGQSYTGTAFFLCGNSSYGSGPSAGSQSGYLSAGDYSLYCSASFINPPLLSANSGSYQVIFIVSISNIMSSTISGRITDSSSGLPISGATVQFGYVQAMSDTNGYYSQSGLPLAAYNLTVSASNYAILNAVVTTLSSQTNVIQNFSLTPLSYSVQGHVYCICDSNAIAGASVQIGNYSATTGANGAYAITNVVPGTYTNTASANNYASLTTSLTVSPSVPVLTNDIYLTNLTFGINPLFDSTITTNASASTITNTIKAAIQVYKQSIANPLCMTILFSATNGADFYGASDAALNYISYSQYLADLNTNQVLSANDNTALANLPPGPGTGINGNTEVILTKANLAAIGETALAAGAAATGLSAGFYGQITLDMSSLSILQSTVEHEINEVLGIGGWGSSLYLETNYTGQPLPTAGVGALDLFRYRTNGMRSFTFDTNATPYFSINGGTNKLVFFNQFGYGSDYGDWGDGKSPADGDTNNPPQVQDAFGSGNPSMGSNEFIALDVIGYTLMSPTPTIQTAVYAAHAFTLGWAALPGQLYQVQFKTNLTGNVWYNLGGPVTAAGMTAAISDTNASNAQRFYRVVASSPPAVPAPPAYQPQEAATVTSSALFTNAPITHRFLRARP